MVDSSFWGGLGVSESVLMVLEASYSTTYINVPSLDMVETVRYLLDLTPVG